jgi:hypothetical protein
MEDASKGFDQANADLPISGVARLIHFLLLKGNQFQSAFVDRRLYCICEALEVRSVAWNLAQILADKLNVMLHAIDGSLPALLESIKRLLRFVHLLLFHLHHEVLDRALMRRAEPRQRLSIALFLGR